MHATDHDPTSSKKQTLTVIQCSHLCSQRFTDHAKKRPVHLNFERPVRPALLLLMHTMKILQLVLTHHSIYQLLAYVLMSYKGGIMCYLPHCTQGALKCRQFHRQNQRLHCHVIFYSIFFIRISEHFSSTPCKIFMKHGLKYMKTVHGKLFKQQFFVFLLAEKHLSLAYGSPTVVVCKSLLS